MCNDDDMTLAEAWAETKVPPQLLRSPNVAVAQSELVDALRDEEGFGKKLSDLIWTNTHAAVARLQQAVRGV